MNRLRLRAYLFSWLAPLLLPFQILKRGGFPLLIYIFISSIAWGAVVHCVSHFTLYYLRIGGTKFPASSNFIKEIMPWVSIGYACVAAPILITFFSLLTLHICQQGKVSLSLLMKNALRATLTMYSSIRITFRATIPFLVPLCAMVFLYFRFVRHIENSLAYFIYTTSCFVVWFSVLWRAAPLFTAPFVALVTSSPALQAVWHAPRIMRGHTGGLVILLIPTCALIWLALYYQPLAEPYSAFFFLVGALVVASMWSITSATIAVVTFVINSLRAGEQDPYKALENQVSHSEATALVEVERAYIK